MESILIMMMKVVHSFDGFAAFEYGQNFHSMKKNKGDQGTLN